MVLKPERHIGECVQEMNLQGVIQHLLGGSVRSVFGLSHEAIRYRISYSAHGWRRPSLAVKGIPENIRGFHPNPRQTIHLESSGFDVTVKCAPIMALDQDVNSDLVELVLNDSGQPQAKGVGGGFIRNNRAMVFIIPRFL